MKPKEKMYYSQWLTYRKQLEKENKEGLELVGFIKEQDPELPVVVTSAYREFDYAVEALNRGADYFLKKPINPEELREVLKRLV